MNKEELRAKLKEIMDNDCKVPEGYDPYALALVMLEHLGDVDPELRDNLIYSTLAKWVTKKVFSKEQLKELMQSLLDEKHLYYKLGEQNTDSVFMRAFSVLILACIVYTHREDPLLTIEELKEVKSKIIGYMNQEKDVRGYVDIGGWAHTAAHTADAIDEVALCEELGREDLLEILEAIKQKVSIAYYAYNCYEDERLSIATNSLISRNVLSEEEVSAWVRSFAEFDKKVIYPNHYYLLSNMRNYLNSLYYRLPKDQYATIKSAISETILAIRRF